jgi:hypothetical protein
MGATVGHAGDAEVEVADRGRRSVVEREVAPRYGSMEHTCRPSLDLPAEHIVVERGTGRGVIGREVDEDQRVRLHVATIAKMD